MAGEPVPLSDQVFLLPGPVSTFLLQEGGACVAVDTGLTADTGRRVLRGVAALGGELVAIVNSHAHGDHFGGNAFLRKRTAAEVYAPAQEEASRADRILDGDIALAGLTTRAVPAPGHAINQHAFQVDDVLLGADALFGEEALTKHQGGYCYNPRRHRGTPDLLEGVKARIPVPSHGPPTAEGQALLTANRRNPEGTRRAVMDALGSPGLAEEVAARVTNLLGLQPTLEAYHLNLSTIKGHLAALRAEGLATSRLEEGRLLRERR